MPNGAVNLPKLDVWPQSELTARGEMGTLRLCELSGRVPPEFSLHWRGLCSVMLLSQRRPATACLLVSSSGPDDGALESSLPPPPLACYLCAVMLAFVTSKAEIIGSPPASNKAVQMSEEATLHILGSPSLWDGKMDSIGLVRGRFRGVIWPPIRLQIRLTWFPVCLLKARCHRNSSLSTAVGTGRPDRSQPLCELLTIRELKPSVSLPVPVPPEPCRTDGLR